MDKVAPRYLACCFLLFAAFVAGPAWISYKLFNPAIYGGSDPEDYVALATGQVVTHPIHRYRIVEPLIVRAFARHHPREGFFILNVALTAGAATCLFTMLLEDAPLVVALLASLVLLGSRDVIAATGMPSVDPAAYLVVSGCFLALKKRCRWALAAILLLGPTVKENCLFLFPLILVFGALSLMESALYAAFGLLLALMVRMLVGSHGLSENIGASVAHGRNLFGSLWELFTPHGIGTLWMAFGPFWLIAAWGFRDWPKLDPQLLWWLPLVFAQMLLSGPGEASRMGVLAFPTIATAVAFTLTPYLASPHLSLVTTAGAYQRPKL
jgi:hypothetical protein